MTDNEVQTWLWERYVRLTTVERPSGVSLYALPKGAVPELVVAHETTLNAAFRSLFAAWPEDRR